MLTGDQWIQIQRAATAGDISLLQMDITDEVRKAYDEVFAEINEFDGKTMLFVPSEWPDDTYDELIEASYAAYGAPRTLDEMEADNATLVSKAADERRFTLGPMYIPNRRDAHAEWTDPDELQKAVWEYVKKGDRRIRLQHDRDTVAGEWVEVMAWPYEVSVPMMRKDGSTQDMTFPENTVFLGVVWEPWAWELVKADKLRGYSIGGKAQRLLVDLPEGEE